MLQTKAYKHIRSKLLSGQFPPTQRISARRLAEELDVSLTPVREAILRLSNEGLVHRVPQSGTYPRQVTRDELQGMLELRQAIESMAAAAAAERAKPAAVDEIRHCCETFGQLAAKIERQDPSHPTGDVLQQAAKAERAFHEAVVMAADNPVAERMFGECRVLTAYSQLHCELIGTVSLEDMRWSYHNHAEILAAIESRNPQAARSLMFEHIGGAMRSILERYDRWVTQKGQCPNDSPAT